jgi:hypothetical protein
MVGSVQSTFLTELFVVWMGAAFHRGNDVGKSATMVNAGNRSSRLKK